MYTGDLKPDLDVVLSNPDSPVDVSSASNIRIMGRRGDTLLFDRSPDETDTTGDTSVVTMYWVDGDTDTIGRIQIEVEVTWPGLKPQTFRADGGVDIHSDFDRLPLEAPTPDTTFEVADAYVNAVLVGHGAAWATILSAIADTDATALVRNLDALIVGTITRDGNDAALSAAVEWPDGTPGLYTADTISVAFPGAVDAYHVTYGTPTERTYTQPLVTRNANGAVIELPQIVVS
jgi:hypothetical protein